jgi:hypothetical protein
LYASSDCLGKWDGHMPWVMICDAKYVTYATTIRSVQNAFKKSQNKQHAYYK